MLKTFILAAAGALALAAAATPTSASAEPFEGGYGYHRDHDGWERRDAYPHRYGFARPEEGYDARPHVFRRPFAYGAGPWWAFRHPYRFRPYWG